MDSLTVRSASGGVIEVLVYGDQVGLPLVYHHGTPAAAVPFPLLDREASSRGLRVISYSRPGYGESSPRRAGTVADDTGEVVEVLRHLGVDGFVTLGWSGGGPRALACAASMPDRCLAAATLAGVAPFAAEGLDWFAGMGQENLDELGAADQGVEPLDAFLTVAAAGLREVSGAQIADGMGELVSGVDKAALTGELADHVAAAFRHAMRHGISGWRDDDLAIVQSWGFDLSSVTVPVSIWQGAADRMVPFTHGQWLAAHVAGARARLLPEEGHISLVMQVGRMLDDLLLSRHDAGR